MASSSHFLRQFVNRSRSQRFKSDSKEQKKRLKDIHRPALSPNRKCGLLTAGARRKEVEIFHWSSPKAIPATSDHSFLPGILT